MPRIGRVVFWCLAAVTAVLAIAVLMHALASDGGLRLLAVAPIYLLLLACLFAVVCAHVLLVAAPIWLGRLGHRMLCDLSAGARGLALFHADAGGRSDIWADMLLTREEALRISDPQERALALGLEATQRLCMLGGLAVTALLFPTALSALGSMVFAIVRGLFTTAPDQLSAMARQGMTCIENIVGTDAREALVSNQIASDLIQHCVPRMLDDLRYGVAGAFDQVVQHSRIESVSTVDLLLALTVFAGATLGISRYATVVEAKARMWILFAGLVFFSIYLALSATLAVALLEDDAPAPEAVSAAALEARLHDLMRQGLPAELAAAFASAGAPGGLFAGPAPAPAPAAILPGADMGAGAATAGSTFPGGGSEADDAEAESQPTGASQRILQDLDAALFQATALADEAELSGKMILARAQGEAGEALIASVAAQYAADHAESGKEIGAHYRNTIGWFADGMERLRRAAAACLMVEHGARVWIRRAHDASQDDRRRSDLLLGWERWRKEAEERRSLCFGEKGLGAAPVRPGFGEHLGPAGKMAGWLLTARSEPLTLVSGLVGYGLLGALAARFVRRSDAVAARAERRPLGYGALAEIIFSGFAAAMAVYLAAYGGLAIFTTGGGGEGAQPNAYAVFATCLGGAAYYPEIWRKISDWIGRGGSSGAAGDDGAHAGPAKDGEPQDDGAGRSDPAPAAPPAVPRGR